VPEPVIRLLGAHEAGRLVEAIRAVYGATYDVVWLYDESEVASRISRGVLLSAIAEMDGELVCHSGLTLHSPADRVGHAGQAVTLPAARGHHLFTATKRFLAREAAGRRLFGMYSEATAAHPYSQRANVELGAHESGFLLGYIPASVENSVSPGRNRRQSAALFYLALERAPGRQAYVPACYREVVLETIAVCELHARMADVSRRTRVPRRSTLHTSVNAVTNVAVVTATEPGTDLSEAVSDARGRLFGHGYDAVYVDLPLEVPSTGLVADPLHRVGMSYSGVFPNPKWHGDVLRLQSVRSGTFCLADVAVASDHGRRLLGYVVDDLGRSGHEVDQGEAAPRPA